MIRVTAGEKNLQVQVSTGEIEDVEAASAPRGVASAGHPPPTVACHVSIPTFSESPLFPTWAETDKIRFQGVQQKHQCVLQS